VDNIPKERVVHCPKKGRHMKALSQKARPMEANVVDKREAADLIRTYSKQLNLKLSTECCGQMGAYLKALITWPARLTAVKGNKDLVAKHIMDSLTVAVVIETLAGKRLMDVGSGPGLPGLVLKIFEPRLNVTLLDATTKNIEFMKAFIKSKQLGDEIEVIHGRAETFGRDEAYRASYDVVCCRALGTLNVDLELCLPFVKMGGLMVALKGPMVEQELNQCAGVLGLLGGSVRDVHYLKLPFLEHRRCVVVIEKTQVTPDRYPRRTGIPKKRPLS